MKLHRAFASVLVFGISASAATAQVKSSGVAKSSGEALSAIREADIRSDIFTLAGVAMRGREAGTLDELRASVWVAERARAAGLQPAGEDGSLAARLEPGFKLER